MSSIKTKQFDQDRFNNMSTLGYELLMDNVQHVPIEQSLGWCDATPQYMIDIFESIKATATPGALAVLAAATEPDITPAQIAYKLGTSENSVKGHIKRLRQAFREAKEKVRPSDAPLGDRTMYPGLIAAYEYLEAIEMRLTPLKPILIKQRRGRSIDKRGRRASPTEAKQEKQLERQRLKYEIRKAWCIENKLPVPEWDPRDNQSETAFNFKDGKYEKVNWNWAQVREHALVIEQRNFIGPRLCEHELGYEIEPRTFLCAGCKKIFEDVDMEPIPEPIPAPHPSVKTVEREFLNAAIRAVQNEEHRQVLWMWRDEVSVEEIAKRV